MAATNTKYWLRSSQSSFLDTKCLDQYEVNFYKNGNDELSPDPLLIHKLREDLHLALENINDEIINGKFRLKALSDELTSKWMGDILTQQDVINSLEDTIEEKDNAIEEKNKLMKSCDNLRDKAIIDVMDDSGVRPHEILELQIKHIKNANMKNRKNIV